MPARDSNSNRETHQAQRDLLVFLLILLLSFACLLATAQFAVRLPDEWQASAGMLSELDPDEQYVAEDVRLGPLRPEVMTPPSWDLTRVLTPAGASVIVPPDVLVPAPTATSTPAGVAGGPTPTRTVTSPTPTQTPTNVLSPTPTSTSTRTATPTALPSPSSTPTSAPTPTDTSTPEPTSVPTKKPPKATDTPTPTPSPTASPTPSEVSPPSVLSITPNQGVNSDPVTVVIRGANFFGMPTARLGINVPLTITAATADTLTGTVPAGLLPSVYALTVSNPDGRSGTLSPAYVALSPDTVLATDLVSTFGTAATSPGNGDNDQVQVVFLEVPAAFPGPLYVHIYDPDVGGTLDEQQGGAWDTLTTFSLFGGSGAYTDPLARRPTYATTTDPGISSGTPIISRTIGVSGTVDGTWTLFAMVNPDQGEAVGDTRIFKLSVVGANSGDDGNLYNVVLSAGPDPLVSPSPPGGRIFAFSWTLPLASDSPRRLYPYIRPGVSTFTQFNWDLDKPSGAMELHMPARDVTVPDSGISANASAASSSHQVGVGESQSTWTVAMAFAFLSRWNDLTFWADGDGTALAIFTCPTMAAPP